MKRLSFTPKELKILIDKGKLLGEGTNGCVFTYGNVLIKLDYILYHLLKDHPLKECEAVINYRYLGGKENFDNPSQIEYLVSKQKNIFLTRLPEGIIELKGFDLFPGIIIPYHENYVKLENLPKSDLESALPILKKLLNAAQELEQNEISDEDIYHPLGNGQAKYNILYNQRDAQLIDLDGEDLIWGRNYRDSRSMYIELGQVIIDFFEENSLTPNYPRWYTDTFEKNKELVKELDLFYHKK